MNLFDARLNRILGQIGDTFALFIAFGNCIAKSCLECEWIDPALGLFRPVGNASIVYSVADMANCGDHYVDPTPGKKLPIQA